MTCSATNGIIPTMLVAVAHNYAASLDPTSCWEKTYNCLTLLGRLCPSGLAHLGLLGHAVWSYYMGGVIFKCSITKRTIDQPSILSKTL